MIPTLDIDTSELDALTARLEALSGPRALEPLLPTLRALGREVAAIMAQYPPERPNQRYMRTGDLGRAWQPDEGVYVGNGIVVTVSNATEYADYVQGENQAWMHEDRWDTIEDAERELADPVADKIADAVDSLVRALGL